MHHLVRFIYKELKYDKQFCQNIYIKPGFNYDMIIRYRMGKNSFGPRYYKLQEAILRIRE